MNKVELLKRTVNVFGNQKTLVVIGIQVDSIEDPYGFFEYPKNVKTAPGWIINSKLIHSEAEFIEAKAFSEKLKNAKIECRINRYGYEWLFDSIAIEDETDYWQNTWVEYDFKLCSLEKAIDEMIECGCSFFNEDL